MEASREEGSRTRVRKRIRWEDAFCLFFNYNDFLLKPIVNLITYNIPRRFSITVLECVS